MIDDRKEDTERRFKEAMLKIKREELLEETMMIFFLVAKIIIIVGIIIALFKYIF